MRLSDLHAMIERLAVAHSWTVGPDHLIVSTSNDERHQEIRFTREGDHVLLTAVVLDSRDVRANDKRWRELALHAWTRNAESNLVTFTFDERDRLVARIRHLARHLDSEELELYVQVLAAESDRFEYMLTGQDRF